MPPLPSTVDQDAPTLTAVLLYNPVLTRGKVGVNAGYNEHLSQMQREINELKEDILKLKAQTQALSPGQCVHVPEKKGVLNQISGLSA